MDEIIPISALNQYIFCPRRCGLMHIEGIWHSNAHTAKGTILHKKVDKKGYEARGDAKALRALPLYSTKYGLSGKADIVEVHSNEIVPIEYKKGRKREFENDNIQLMAQALCLDEMFTQEVKRGFIYHTASRRRREVIFDVDLRDKTISTIKKVRELLEAEIVPVAEFKPRCKGCSLYEVCLPRLSDKNEREILLDSSGDQEG